MLLIFIIILLIIGIFLILPIIGLILLFFLKKNSLLNINEFMSHIYKGYEFRKNFSNSSSEASHTNESLSYNEALQILGLKENSTKDQINSAYYRLMHSLHPDKGGSPYLAQKLNQARDILINK